MINGVFYDILERMGGSVFWSIFFFTSGANTFFNAFLFYLKDYSCPLNITNCHEYVCSLAPQQRLQFVDNNFSSLGSKFGDYRCDGSIYLQSMQSFIYVGGIFGGIFGSFLNQYISKRSLLRLTVLMNIIGIIITTLGNSIFLASIGLFINFAAKWIQVEIVPCIMMQTVEQQEIGRHIMVVYMFFALGVTLNGLVFKSSNNWQVILIFYQILPAIITFGSLFFLIEETPFDSIVYYQPQQSLLAFQRIASINNKEDNGITLEMISNIKLKYEQNQQSKHKQVLSFLDLFRFDSLRLPAIITLSLNFLINYEFCVPELIIRDYSLDIYECGIILGLSELLSSIVCFFIVNIERKKIIISAQLIGFILSILIFFFASCNKSFEKCDVSTSVLQICGLFFFRFVISTAYNFFYLAQFEIFPTQIRSIALQMTSMGSISAIIIAPILQKFFESKKISMVITFSAVCLIVMLITFKMPETYNIRSPEMIKQLQEKQ